MRMSMRIQPDLFPPQWKPQDLSETKIRPHTSLVPCAPVRLDNSGVLDRKTQLPIFTITKEAVHAPFFLSSKPLLIITRSGTKSPLGSIRFHRMTSSDIQLNIYGCEIVLTGSRQHRYWSFEPSSLAKSKEERTPWYWKRDRLLPRCVILINAAGRAIARIDGNILSFEKADLSDETVDEIIVTAVALAEHARRHGRSADINNLGQNIGDLAGGHRAKQQGGHHASRHRGGSSGGAFIGGYSGGGDGGYSCGGGDGGSGGGGGGDGGGGGC